MGMPQRVLRLQCILVNLEQVGILRARLGPRQVRQNGMAPAFAAILYMRLQTLAVLECFSIGKQETMSANAV